MSETWILSTLVTFLLLLFSQRSFSEPTLDKQALTSFLNQVPHASRIQWNVSDSACNWVGVTCDPTRSHVHNLRLPAAGLVGSIPPNTIGRLSELRVLSIHSNRLTGTLPSDFANLTFLRAIYVGKNQLSGEFPASLTQLTRLARLDLSNNNFSGSIPFGVNNLTALNALLLQNNNFSGTIPSIESSNLVEFSVANNSLNGSIPESLVKFPESSFTGNLQLCGGPLQPCNSSFFPSPSPSPEAIVPSSPAEEVGGKKKLSKGAIIAIAVAAALVLLILLLWFVFCLLRRRSRGSSSKTTAKGAAAAGVGAIGARAAGLGGGGAGEAGTSSSKDDLTSGTGPEGGQRNRLVFVNGGKYSFDLEDLLRASAEVLGKGSVGTSYKAVLEEGTTVVVKRLKDVVAGKKEFELQMEVVGKCKHDNVVPLRAFYYSKDEKLLVIDYFSNGSLSALLHGNILTYLYLYFPTLHFYSHITMSLLNFQSSFLLVHNLIKMMVFSFAYFG